MAKKKKKPKSFSEQVASMFSRNKGRADNPNNPGYGGMNSPKPGAGESIGERINFGGTPPRRQKKKPRGRR